MNDALRELDHRNNDRIDVWLLWRESDNQVMVSVADEKTGDAFTITLREGEKPMDVFQHPYAYAAFHGIDVSAEPRRQLAARVAPGSAVEHFADLARQRAVREGLLDERRVRADLAVAVDRRVRVARHEEDAHRGRRGREPLRQ